MPVLPVYVSNELAAAISERARAAGLSPTKYLAALAANWICEPPAADEATTREDPAVTAIREGVRKAIESKRLDPNIQYTARIIYMLINDLREPRPGSDLVGFAMKLGPAGWTKGKKVQGQQYYSLAELPGSTRINDNSWRDAVALHVSTALTDTVSAFEVYKAVTRSLTPEADAYPLDLALIGHWFRKYGWVEVTSNVYAPADES